RQSRPACRKEKTMKTSIYTTKSFPEGNPSSLRLRLRTNLLVATMLLLFADGTIFGQSAVWDLAPGSGDWNTATNWTPMTVPNSSADTATFASSAVTSISVSANTEVNGVVFNAGAGAFTITSKPN